MPPTFNNYKMASRVLLILTFATILHIGSANQTLHHDEYVQEAQASCQKRHDALNCLKYRALKYVSGLAESGWSNDSLTSPSSEPDEGAILKLVRIEENLKQPVKSAFFGDSRQIGEDSEVDKLIKFGVRQARAFLGSHGISFALPEGATTTTSEVEYEEDASENNEVARSSSYAKDNARGKKKKLAILLPFLSLMSLFKVKLLLVPVLLTVMFIKKIIVLAALFLPTILSTLKVCKMPPHVPHVPHHAQWAGAESGPEYSSGYGAAYNSYAGAGNGQGYAKEWAASRAYNGYKPTQSINQQPTGYIMPQGNVVYPSGGSS